MMFLDDNFLLNSETARKLYRDHAAGMPIIDYHCHLDPKMIAEDHRFSSITELWLGGDHYKWRAMRSNGVPERYITGDATDREKFMKWAETVPYAFRNPLYHWTHLEFKTAFGIDKTLNPETAGEIYDRCNDMLSNDPGMSARGLMRKYRVEVVCTTDDPVDSLEYHKAIRESGFEIKVLPTWRPDKAMAIEGGEAFVSYIRQLGEVAGMEIDSVGALLAALQKRHDFFEENGCRLSDHGISEFYADDYTSEEVGRIFADALAGAEISEEDVRKFKSMMMYEFGRMDAASGWAQQFHYGTIRNSNTKMMRAIGPDTGFDSIGEFNTALSCARFLDRLNLEDSLARTILYNLNPSANEVMATMIGNFQDGSIPGKIQLGSGWWFNDQMDGIRRQLDALSLLGLLSRFVGMLTDSRSFLSYPRHDYFRRILCDLVGSDIEKGLIPYEGYEAARVDAMIEDICYYNAKNYFKF